MNSSGNTNNNNLCNVNSDGSVNSNSPSNAFRPVASINCGYAIIDCIRDNIETDYVL
ncbi:MAG: hypothetical protein UFI45_00880 [Clostridia bacterium]|nr:hypothetical protein [Clostridia bacterium]